MAMVEAGYAVGGSVSFLGLLQEISTKWYFRAAEMYPLVALEAEVWDQGVGQHCALASKGWGEALCLLLASGGHGHCLTCGHIAAVSACVFMSPPTPGLSSPLFVLNQPLSLDSGSAQVIQDGVLWFSTSTWHMQRPFSKQSHRFWPLEHEHVFWGTTTQLTTEGKCTLVNICIWYSTERLA